MARTAGSNESACNCSTDISDGFDGFAEVPKGVYKTPPTRSKVRKPARLLPRLYLPRSACKSGYFERRF